MNPDVNPNYDSAIVSHAVCIIFAVMIDKPPKQPIKFCLVFSVNIYGEMSYDSGNVLLRK